MREILYRGKCIDETCLKGQWLEGQILHDGVTGKYYIHRDNCLNESDNVGEEGLLQFVAYEVDPETVCQYTGLTDKNGRKIFEGDIISFSHSKIAEGQDERYFMPDYEKYTRNYAVEFVNTYHTYGLRARNKSIHFKISQSTINTHDAKIIGNIFDNKDLLEE